MNNLNGVALWFAKDEKGNIVTIDKLNKEYKGKYMCPLCGSEVISKALESTKVSSHFAHIERESCSGESVVHWWVKNELIKKDDVIEIITNETKQFMCKEIILEKSYETPHGLYRPDITLITYEDNTIFIEINYNNKKKADDYYLKWEYLKCPVIEFGVKNIYSEGEDSNKIKISNSFKAIYYDGIIRNINKSDKDYISYRKSILYNFSDCIEQIEWFIDDIYRYICFEQGDIKTLSASFSELLKNKNNHIILESLYRNNRCQSVMKEIIQYRDSVSVKICEYVKEKFGFMEVKCGVFADERLIYNRIFSKYILRISKSAITTELLGIFNDFNYGYNDTLDIDITYMDEFTYEFVNREIKEFIRYLKMEKVKRLKIQDIIRAYNEDRYINIEFHEGLRNEYLSFSVGEAKFSVYKNGIISINDINICTVNINDIDDINRGIKFSLSYSTGKNCLFPDNIISIYDKISSVYKKTNCKYNVNLDRNYISIYTIHDDEKLVEYQYSDKTTIKEVMNVFSDSIRHYLYGGQ